VATHVGDVPEILEGGRYGQLVSPGDPNILAIAIEEVYRNREGVKTIAFAAG
jgi:glycosyltransferase involved in cell wall biosynthesis